MLTHPYVAGQLAREHSRQLRADASQRELAAPGQASGKQGTRTPKLFPIRHRSPHW